MQETKPTREDYMRVFERECANEYPVIDLLEQELGYAVERERLEDAARTMACPLKVNPPNWQHGRLIYALVRKLAAASAEGDFIDIGTAKGFSAVVMGWAIEDAGLRERTVYSVDVMDPEARVRRNSVLELDGFKAIHEYTNRYLAPTVATQFFGEGSLALLERLALRQCRIAFAFVDGKHDGSIVAREAAIISKMQRSGDVILFDDLQLPGIAAAFAHVPGYSTRQVVVNSNRCYGIATKL